MQDGYSLKSKIDDSFELSVITSEGKEVPHRLSDDRVEFDSLTLVIAGRRIVPDGAPTIVCLCGSTRFSAAFREANLRETLAGKIVLSIGCDTHSDEELFADKTAEELAQIKADLDELHRRKIDIADEVLILNVGGYIGESTAGELAYAREKGKLVRFLEVG